MQQWILVHPSWWQTARVEYQRWDVYQRNSRQPIFDEIRELGPVSPLLSNSAKLFASLYALFSGLVFVLAMGVVLSPLVYSLMKQLRLNKCEKD